VDKPINKSRKWKRIAAAATLILAPVGYIVVRSRILLARTEQLIAVSERFPREYDVGDKTRKPLLYIALGDSTAAGVGVSRVEETYPYLVAQALASERDRCVHVINAAKSGARIADVEAYQLPALIGRKPDVVTMSIGANDATHRTNIIQFQSYYEVVLKRFNGLEFLVATTPDMAYAPAIQPIYGNIAGAKARDQNSWLKSRIAAHRFKLIDIYTEGKLDFNKDPGLYASDRFHPSAKGYAIWAKLFVKQL
jgi:lysophospholipase L1-like esterase